MRSARPNAPAASSDPTVISGRGPTLDASPPKRADSRSMTTVTGSSAVPAANGVHPLTSCSWSTSRKKKTDNAA